jgi:hypothetical protein
MADAVVRLLTRLCDLREPAPPRFPRTLDLTPIIVGVVALDDLAPVWPSLFLVNIFRRPRSGAR